MAKLLSPGWVLLCQYVWFMDAPGQSKVYHRSFHRFAHVLYSVRALLRSSLKNE
jgi:hypothetical protein